MPRKMYEINEFVNICGYFYNAYIEKDISVNNGYNCKHPSQEESETVNEQSIGKCYCWSCPLGYEVFEEDFESEDIDKNGWDTFEETTFIIVEQD